MTTRDLGSAITFVAVVGGVVCALAASYEPAPPPGVFEQAAFPGHFRTAPDPNFVDTDARPGEVLIWAEVGDVTGFLRIPATDEWHACASGHAKGRCPRCTWDQRLHERLAAPTRPLHDHAHAQHTMPASPAPAI